MMGKVFFFFFFFLLHAICQKYIYMKFQGASHNFLTLQIQQTSANTQNTTSVSFQQTSTFYSENVKI